ncbi:MAG: hypothetical protein ACTSWW_01205 [Promethearchaeota archaeon]
MGATESEKELKRIIKIRTKGKEEPVCVFVRVRVAKDVADLKIKEEDGIITLRVNSTHEDFPKWYVHGYLIALKNLRLHYKEIKNQAQVLNVLTTPNRVVHAATKQLLNKLDKDFGGIVPDGSKKVFFKTEKFKKSKDYFKVRMKAM